MEQQASLYYKEEQKKEEKWEEKKEEEDRWLLRSITRIKMYENHGPREQEPL